MLQVVISPAKKMRIDTDVVEPAGIPPFPKKSRALLHRLRDMTRDELKDLWGTSDKLTDENLERLRVLEVPLSLDEARGTHMMPRLTPAIFSYDGIQYTSLAPSVLDETALEWLQGHLWILSGFYGCVRPFDAVMPYRLEMGASLEMPAPDDHSCSASGSGRAHATRSLYELWGGDIAAAVTGSRSNIPCDTGSTPASSFGSTPAVDTVVNLASVEYAKAVLPHLPEGVRSVTCIFGELLRNDKPVQRATASKIARGSMLRWMAENGIEDPADLLRFSTGYAFETVLSRTDAHGNETIVFMRS